MHTARKVGRLVIYSVVWMMFWAIGPDHVRADGVTVVGKTEIVTDTVWQGNILVTGDVRVKEGATLIILPDTKISFKKIAPFGEDKLSLDKANHFPRAELIVRGRLIAQGLPDKPIVFTSAEKKPLVADWGAVNFIGSKYNIMEYCDISYGHTSVHCHSAQVVVSHCNFHDNGVAVGLKNVKNIGLKCVVSILYNKIHDNGGGILIGGLACPVVSHNDIKGNKFFGIFTKKSGPCCIRYNNIVNNGKGIILYAVKKLFLRDNNIANNTDYNISLLEGQEQDVMAMNNWWGTSDPSRIRKGILDHHSDKSLGTVNFSDFLKAPVAGAGIL